MSFATRQRLLLGLAVIMMLIPTFLLGAGKLGQAPMFEGDKKKEMSCAPCEGLGKGEDKEACQTCRGRGVAEFILPGPNRPIQLVGTVKDSEGELAAQAEIGTKVADGTEQQEVILKTNDDGQFGLKVPPGDYEIRISHSGRELTQTLHVEPRTEPLPARGGDTLHKLEMDFVLSE